MESWLWFLADGELASTKPKSYSIPNQIKPAPIQARLSEIVFYLYAP